MTTITEIDPSLMFDRPRQSKVSSPAVDEQIALADAAAARAALAAAEESRARGDALRLSTKIQALRTKRDEVAKKLQNLQGIDIPSHRAKCEETAGKLMGIEPLDAIQNNSLNSALYTLAALREKERLLPGIIKETKSDLTAVTAELAKLESTAK